MCILMFFLINFISPDVILGLSCSLIAQRPHPYNKVGNSKVFYIFSLCVFGIERILKFCFVILQFLLMIL